MTWTYALDHPHDLDLAELKALVGGKAANLAIMSRDLGLPVPPGFVITTEACRAYLAGGWPDGLDVEIRARMAEVEAVVGRRFGDPADPLLVSVRSGAPVSMPGMMDTILNLGLTSETTAGLAAASGDPAFAEACRERLVAMFRETAGASEVPDDPWVQLRVAIEAVFRSWNGDRAVTYRRREGIPDDLGTGVVVQAMVFGNRGPDSGTGVLFTRNPATGDREPYGDVLFEAQGEEVVAGISRTEPITVLRERMPAVAAELREHALRLERHYTDLCDIEFTIEAGRLWMLQCRVGKRSPQAALRIAVDMAEDEGFPLSREEAVRRVAPVLANPPMIATGRSAAAAPLLTGLPASPGTASGAIVVSPEAAVAAAEEGRAVILVRNDTSPDDVHGMAKAAGILTATGGLASHAAVVARGWGIPAVVGAAGLSVGPDGVRVSGRSLAVGAVLTIDGSTGEVFEGEVAATTAVAPEAATLLAWARELGIPVGDGEAGGAASSPEDASRTASRDEIVRALGIKGFGTPGALSEALGCDPAAVQDVLDALVADGLATATAGAFRLTAAGTARAEELLAADRAGWGDSAANDALDAFLSLDHRVKEIVTAWQLREPEVINDHSDQDYDRGVLEALEALHADAVAWMGPVEVACPRLAGYRPRLTRALLQALAGDQKYVASPRVDSYHGIWFELHEELIQLAGRTRAEEVEAGRA